LAPDELSRLVTSFIAGLSAAQGGTLLTQPEVTQSDVPEQGEGVMYSSVEREEVHRLFDTLIEMSVMFLP
jgi:hypothetical protein